jgi:hypothetical protein
LLCEQLLGRAVAAPAAAAPLVAWLLQAAARSAKAAAAAAAVSPLARFDIFVSFVRTFGELA